MIAKTPNEIKDVVIKKIKKVIIKEENKNVQQSVE